MGKKDKKDKKKDRGKISEPEQAPEAPPPDQHFEAVDGEYTEEDEGQYEWVNLPTGIVPGQTFVHEVCNDEGDLLFNVDVVFPDNMEAGQDYRLYIGGELAAWQDEQNAMMRGVEVPAGMMAGDVFPQMIQDADGRDWFEMDLEVPDGVAPGQIFQVYIGDHIPQDEPTMAAPPGAPLPPPPPKAPLHLPPEAQPIVDDEPPFPALDDEPPFEMVQEPTLGMIDDSLAGAQYYNQSAGGQGVTGSGLEVEGVTMDPVDDFMSKTGATRAEAESFLAEIKAHGHDYMPIRELAARYNSNVAQRKLQQPASFELFNSFNEDGSGGLEANEIKKVLDSLHFEWDEGYIDDVMAQFASVEDPNFMDYDGFRRLWEHLGTGDNFHDDLPHLNNLNLQQAGDITHKLKRWEAHASAVVGAELAMNDHQRQQQGDGSPGVGMAISEWEGRRLAELKEEKERRLEEQVLRGVEEQDHLMTLLGDEDILRALFLRVDTGNRGVISRAAWIDYLQTDLEVQKMFGLDPDQMDADGDGEVSRDELENEFSRWPVVGITFGVFVGALRARFGHRVGIVYTYEDEVDKVVQAEAEAVKRIEQPLSKLQARWRGKLARRRETAMNRAATDQATQAKMFIELEATLRKSLYSEDPQERVDDATTRTFLEVQLEQVVEAKEQLEAVREVTDKLKKLERTRVERECVLRPITSEMPIGDFRGSAPDEWAASGWMAAKDPKSGMTYYYHKQSNVTTWKRPMVAQDAPPPPPPPIESEPEPEPEPEPELEPELELDPALQQALEPKSDQGQDEEQEQELRLVVADQQEYEAVPQPQPVLHNEVASAAIEARAAVHQRLEAAATGLDATAGLVPGELMAFTGRGSSPQHIEQYEQQVPQGAQQSPQSREQSPQSSQSAGSWSAQRAFQRTARVATASAKISELMRSGSAGSSSSPFAEPVLVPSPNSGDRAEWQRPLVSAAAEQGGGRISIAERTRLLLQQREMSQAASSGWAPSEAAGATMDKLRHAALTGVRPPLTHRQSGPNSPPRTDGPAKWRQRQQRSKHLEQHQQLRAAMTEKTVPPQQRNPVGSATAGNDGRDAVEPASAAEEGALRGFKIRRRALPSRSAPAVDKLSAPQQATAGATAAAGATGAAVAATPLQTPPPPTEPPPTEQQATPAPEQQVAARAASEVSATSDIRTRLDSLGRMRRVGRASQVTSRLMADRRGQAPAAAAAEPAMPAAAASVGRHAGDDATVTSSVEQANRVASRAGPGRGGDEAPPWLAARNRRSVQGAGAPSRASDVPWRPNATSASGSSRPLAESTTTAVPWAKGSTIASSRRLAGSTRSAVPWAKEASSTSFRRAADSSVPWANTSNASARPVASRSSRLDANPRQSTFASRSSEAKSRAVPSRAGDSSKPPWARD